MAEDHQTQNAKALVEKNAAVLVPNAHVNEKMIETAISVLSNDQKSINCKPTF